MFVEGMPGDPYGHRPSPPERPSDRTIPALIMSTLLVCFPFMLGREFESMLSGFGASSLPVLTQLVLSSWFAPMWGGLAIAGVLFGLRAGSRIGVLGAFFFAIAGVGLCAAALYMPVVDLTSGLRPQ